MKKFLKNILRELTITFDAMLGGDHRKYGHQEPIDYALSPNMVRDIRKPNPVLAHSNENWVLIERYVNTYNPPDFRLVFKRDGMILDMPVSEESWRAFDGIKFPPTKPTPFEGKGTKGTWRVEKELEKPPRIVAYGVGRYRDDFRTVATMKDNSILSHEDAHLIVGVVNDLRNSS